MGRLKTTAMLATLALALAPASWAQDPGSTPENPPPADPAPTSDPAPSALPAVGSSDPAPTANPAPAAEPTPSSNPLPAQTARSEAPALPTVNGVSVKQENGKTEVAITLTEAKASYSVFRATSPERLMVDISGVTLGDSPMVSTGGLVQRVEFSSFEDSTKNVRVTLFLSEQAVHELHSEGNRILLSLSAGKVEDPMAEGPAKDPNVGIRLSGPQQVADGAVLTSLDFQYKEASSQVILGLKNVEPTISAPKSDLIVVDLPNAVMPDSLQRQLDTRFFASAVNEVRAYSTRTGTRVAISLRAGTTYDVSRAGNLYLITIVTPPEIIAQRDRALQRAAISSPSTPDTNNPGAIGNDANQEVLISGGGKSVDPSSMYGGGTSGFAFATDVVPVSAQHYTGRRVSIDLQDADIHTVFRFLAEYGDINIVSSDDVKGKVTVRLTDVPWDEALAAVLQAKGLGAQQFGNIIRVAPMEQIKSEQQASLDAMRAREQQEPLAVYLAPLNYAQADELAEQVESLLSERGSVEVDTRGNSLIIHDTEEKIAIIRGVLQSLDKANRQITIETRFVEADSNFNRDLGIQWGANLDASATTGYPTGAFFPNSIQAGGATGASNDLSDNLLVDLGTSSSSSIGFSLGSIPGLIDLQARLTALEQEGWGKIVSSPTLRVMDNETGTVEQGSRIPYLSTSNGGTQVQFVSAVLSLEVTPHITAEGTIFLDVHITNDRPDFANLVQGQPAILTKDITTRVLVADGDTAVLGGVYQTQETFSQGRVPGLGKIPLIGYLFRNSSTTRKQAEMLVFITPRVVPVEADGNTGR